MPDEIRTQSQLHAALTLEAMRLGVVPATDLEASTVGRNVEIDIVRRDLEQCRESGARRAFLGDYGLGKSHMLELIEQIALKRNFLVSKVTLDHADLAPSQPKRIYHAIMRGLMYPDLPEQHDGLQPLLDKAARNPDVLRKYLAKTDRTHPLPRTIREQLQAGLHLYLSPAIAYTYALSDVEHIRIPGHLGEPVAWARMAHHLLIDWIEGHPTRSNQDINDELNMIRGRFPKIYSLLDYRPWAKIYGYILNGISQLATDVGYSGLVVVLDEAEFYSLSSAQNRTYARSLFQAWSHAVGAVDEESLPCSSEDLLTGGYGIQRELPLRYSDTPGLYLVFAMTPNSEGIRGLQEALPPQFICYLNPLTAPDYLKMTEHLVALYRTAFSDAEIPEGIEGPLSDVVNALAQQGQLANPRQTMKFLTEFLDIVRFAPGEVPNVIQNLMCDNDF